LSEDCNPDIQVIELTVSERSVRAADVYSGSANLSAAVQNVALFFERQDKSSYRAKADCFPAFGFEELFMLFAFERPSILWLIPLLLILTGCGKPKAECDMPETRSEILQVIADDHGNSLGKYAATHPNTAASGEKKADPENEKPLYTLGEKLITTSISEDKRTLQCSGAISATVNGTKATKEINFTVQRGVDGKLTVSVAPFQF
jgi:hypothetical protein